MFSPRLVTLRFVWLQSKIFTTVEGALLPCVRGIRQDLAIQEPTLEHACELRAQSTLVARYSLAFLREHALAQSTR